MKQILLISVILNIATVLMAANDTIPMEIFGVDRVSYYNEHARQILDTDPDRCRELAILGMNLAEALNDYEGLSNALNYIGLSFYNQGNYPDAIKHFQQSLRVSLRLGARDRVGNLFQKIGMSYLHQKDYQKAIFYYEQTAKVFEQLDYRDHLAKTQFELGVVYYLANEYSNAVNALSSSVENYANIENLRGKAQAYNQLGMTYEEMGNLRKSLAFFQQALEIHHTFNNRDHLAFVLNNMGRIYTKLKMLNEADDVLENAIKYCSSSYAGLFAEIELNQGIVAYKRKNYNLAETMYNQAHQIADSTNNRILLNKIYESYYDLYRSNKNSEKALKYYQLYIASKSETFTKEEVVSPVDYQSIDNDIERVYLTLITLLAVGLLFMIWFNVKLRRKANKALEIIEEHNLTLE